MSNQKPLDIHQQELVNLIRAAHQTLALARKTRSTELARRLAEGKLQIEREWENRQAAIKMDLDAEVAVHESNLDEAMIGAYNNGVPIRRIALDGFGNRYDGGVQQLFTRLRSDGRVGSRDGFQRNSKESAPTASFPKPINVEGILNESTTIDGPAFLHLPEPITLVEADPDGQNGVYAEAVTLTMDPRDPYFARIQKNARVGTPYLHATEATLYLHPATGELVTQESRETGDLIWDHPVARWVKDHPEEAREGFEAAQFSGTVAKFASPAATVDDMKQIAALGEQLGIRGPEASL